MLHIFFIADCQADNSSLHDLREHEDEDAGSDAVLQQVERPHSQKGNLTVLTCETLSIHTTVQ